MKSVTDFLNDLFGGQKLSDILENEKADTIILNGLLESMKVIGENQIHLGEKIDALANNKPQPTPNPTPAPEPTPQPTDNPSDGKTNFFKGASLFVNPKSVVQQYIDTHPGDPEHVVLEKIAKTPTGVWLTGGTEEEVYNQVSEVLAAADGKLATFVIYNIPNRDAGGQSAGGAATKEAYYAWLGAIDAAIKHAGNPNVVLIMEPDAMGFAIQNQTTQYQRFEILKVGMDILTQNPNRSVYLDIAMWNPDTGAMATAIDFMVTQDHMKNVRGFALDTSGFTATSDILTFGESLSGRTKLPYIIDTSRNGNGPSSEQPDPWCNPTGRALGAAPLTVSSPNLDANIWAKPPGESDGVERGGIPAGQFFYARAVEMAHNAK